MKTIRHLGFLGAAILATGVATAQQEAVSRVKLNIESQPIMAALEKFADQTGLQIVFRDETIPQEGWTAPRVVGELTANEALNQLLGNTRLKYEFVNERTVRIMQSTASGGNLPRASLGDVTRLAQADTSTGGGGAPQAGQDVQAGQSPPAEGEAEGTKLEEIVVTAQKRIERLQDVPISISVLSGDELDKSSLAGITEALNRVPGVIATVGNFAGGGTQIAMRGVGASGPISNGASPIGYYLDSVPLARIRDAVIPDSSVYDLERVEVVRGPQGTLYGVNAENGLVRVLTRDANLDAFEFKARTTVSSTEGGGGNYRGDMALNVPIVAGKFAARAVAGYQDSSGWIDQAVEHNINDATVRNYRLKLNARPADALSIGLSAWRSEDERGANDWSDDDGKTTSRNEQRTLNEFDAYSLKIGYEFSRVSLSSATSYVDYTSRNDMDLTPLGLTDVIYNFLTWSKTVSQEIVANSKLDGPWRWTAGVFYRDTDDRFSEQAAAFGGILSNLPDDARSYAGFGEVSRRFWDDKWEWTLGARYFHDQVSSGQLVPLLTGQTELYHPELSSHSTTPRAVLTWYPSDDVTVYGSYAEGFRSRVPLGYTIAALAPTLPEPKPDKLRNYEIGAKTNVWDRRLSLDAALYYVDWQDVQQTLCIPNDIGGCIIGISNGKSASGIGADLGVIARPLDGLELGINVSWNDLTFDATSLAPDGSLLFAEGDRLGFSSKYTLGATADYSFPIGASGLRGSFSASGNYSAEQLSRDFAPGSDAVINVGDNILLARASFAVSSPEDRWTAMLFVDNLNNEDDVAGPRSGFTPTFNPRLRPRTMGLQVEFRW